MALDDVVDVRNIVDRALSLGCVVVVVGAKLLSWVVVVDSTGTVGVSVSVLLIKVGSLDDTAVDAVVDGLKVLDGVSFASLVDVDAVGTVVLVARELIVDASGMVVEAARAIGVGIDAVFVVVEGFSVVCGVSKLGPSVVVFACVVDVCMAFDVVALLCCVVLDVSDDEGTVRVSTCVTVEAIPVVVVVLV